MPKCTLPPLPTDEEAKWLSWPEFLRLCGELRRECGSLTHNGKKRSDAAVAYSLQRYLIFAIFSCVPDRQVGGGYWTEMVVLLGAAV